MKSILQKPLLLVIMMLAISANASAQSYPYAKFEPIPVEVNYFADLEESYDDTLNKGQGLYDAGRALMISGGVLAATGLHIMLVHQATYEPPKEEQVDDLDLTPLVVALFGGAGASLALIGLPLFLAGKYANVQNDGTLMKIGVDSSGWGGMIKLGGGLSKSIAFGGDLIYGYHFNKNFFLGGGVGYKHNLNMKSPSSPVYVHSRFSLGNRSVAPYLGLSGGYDKLNKMPYYGCDVGVRIQKIKHSNRLVTWWLSQDYEVLVDGKHNEIFWTYKIARSF